MIQWVEPLSFLYEALVTPINLFFCRSVNSEGILYHLLLSSNGHKRESGSESRKSVREVGLLSLIMSSNIGLVPVKNMQEP